MDDLEEMIDLLTDMRRKLERVAALNDALIAGSSAHSEFGHSRRASKRDIRRLIEDVEWSIEYAGYDRRRVE